MPEIADANGSSVAYQSLKAAHKLYGRNPTELDPAELAKVQSAAVRQYRLEGRVLSAPEARGVMVPEATLQDALAEIRRRYKDEDEFVTDLQANGLDLEGFETALARELKVDAVLEKVASGAAAVSDIDVELYCHYHPDQFRRPETRRTRQILITINEALSENVREAAKNRIEVIAKRLAKDPKRFEEQALKHSECPTALQGGLLGDMPRGQLYPELDAVLFELEPMQISRTLESPLGFHILRCDDISPEAVLPAAQALPLIRQRLEQRRRHVCQRAWIKQLLNTGSVVA